MLKRVLELKLKLVGALIFVLILVQLITAYIFGIIAEKQIDFQFKQLTNSPLIKVIHRNYHRGLFSSDADTEIAINSVYINNVMKVLLKNDVESQAMHNNVYTIKYATHIEHGIFAGILNGSFVPTLVYAKTDIIYPDNIKKILSKFFNNRPPLTIDNIIYLDKSGRYKIFSPSFNYDEAVSGVKVVWEGMNFIIKYNGAFDQFHSKLSIPNFELFAPAKGIIMLHNLTFSSDSKKSINKINVGEVTVSLDSVKVEWKDKIALNFKPGDVLHMFTGISATEFLNGIDAIDPNGFAFNGVSYTSKSSDENNFFAADANVKFNSLITNGKIYGPMNLNLSVKHIHSPEFSQLIDQLKLMTGKSEAESTENSDASRRQMISVLRKYLGPILVQSPIVQLNQFNLNTPSGLIKISGYATTNSFMLTDLNSQQKFMQKLMLDFNFSVPKPVLSYLFVLQMRYLLSAGNAEMDIQSSNALTKVVNILLDNQIGTWMKKGYLTDDNGILQSHLVIHNGKLFLDGKQSN